MIQSMWNVLEHSRNDSELGWVGLDHCSLAAQLATLPPPEVDFSHRGHLSFGIFSSVSAIVSVDVSSFNWSRIGEFVLRCSFESGF